eukprot:g17128.t1
MGECMGTSPTWLHFSTHVCTSGGLTKRRMWNCCGLTHQDRKRCLKRHQSQATSLWQASCSCSEVRKNLTPCTFKGERGDRGDRPDPDQSDPTLVAMAGANARHFVPEKLPWQVLRNITRVLQVCWLWSGIMAFLKEVHIYQVDFQQHPASERRLNLWGARQLRRHSLSCEVVRSWHMRSFSLELQQDGRGLATWYFFPPAGNLLRQPLLCCQPFRLVSRAAECPCRTVTRLDEAWHVAAGSTVPCEQVLQLLPPDEIGLAEWCLLLAGWDGRRVPIAAVPLIHGASLPPDTSVQPGLDVPLQEDAKDLRSPKV